MNRTRRRSIPLATGAAVILTVLAAVQLNVATPLVLPSVAYNKTFILALIYVAICYVVWFAHEVLTLQCRRQGHFASFYYPLIEENLKILIIYAMSKVSKSLNFLQLAIFIGVVNAVWFAYQHHEEVNYDSKYDKFLQLYSVWASQDTYKRANMSEIGRLFSFCDTRSIASEETLVGKRFSVFNLPVAMTGEQNRSSVVQLDADTPSVPSVHSAPESPVQIEAVQGAKVVDGNQFPEAAHNLNTESTPPTALPMERRLSVLPYELVDKLYSVSPKNTYHLNTAQAYAALDANIDQSSLPQVDQDYDSIGKLDPLICLPYSEENLEEFEGPAEHSPMRNHSKTNHSMHSLDTHYGGGGGGGFKMKLPGGGKVEFGGGGGFDYRRGSPDDDDDGGDEDKTTTSKLVSFVNWFSWLAPPLLPLGSSMASGTFPLLKHRLSKYNLNRACSISTYGTFPQEQFSSQKAQQFKEFTYFVSFYFDHHKIQIDPFFAKYDRLLKDLPTLAIMLHNINTLVWNSLSIIILGLVAMGNLTLWCIPLIVILKMFRLNHLNGGSYKSILFHEAAINVIISTGLGVYFAVSLMNPNNLR